MMRRVALLLSAVPVAVAIAFPAPAAAQPASEGLMDLQAHLRAATTMESVFTQTDARGNTVRGQLVLKRPDKIRFIYDDGTTVVANGGRLDFVASRSGQRQSYSLTDSPLAVLLGARDLARSARIIRNDDNTLMIELRNPDRAGFGRITLAFARIRSAPAGLELIGWNAVDAQNQLTQIRLSNQRYNEPVPDTLFRLDESQARPPRN
jgi:outer membrane lipoprotein-sorting protein